MANDVSGNPWILDTATDTALTNDFTHIYSIMWLSCSAGDALSVQDENSTVKYANTGINVNTAINSPDFGPNGLFMNGVKVPTLGAGKVYVYLKRN